MGFSGVWAESSTKSSTVLTPAHHPSRARHGHAHCTDAGTNLPAYPYKMKVTDMTLRYRKFKRTWDMYYAFDTVTGNSVIRPSQRRIQQQRVGLDRLAPIASSQGSITQSVGVPESVYGPSLKRSNQGGLLATPKSLNCLAPVKSIVLVASGDHVPSKRSVRLSKTQVKP